jgi:predicted dehydrogenase
MLRTGFIGAGRRATSAHYPTLSRIDDIAIEAVSELDEGRLLSVADKYMIPRSFIDYREMLDEVELDAVYVVMSETMVTPIALDCMRAGKHVFIEKPPGANSAETQILLDAAEANGVYCMVGYQRRFAAVTREAMRLVGERGSPTLAIGEFHKNLLGEEPPTTGTLWQDICHVVDLVRFMAGSEPVEVTAYQDAHGSTWPNSYNSLIRFANGAVGIVTGNRASGGRYLRSELHGIGVGCYMRIPDQIEVLQVNKEPAVVSGAELSNEDSTDVYALDGTVGMHRHFAECIRNGVTPSSDIRDVIKTSHLVDQIAGNP